MHRVCRDPHGFGWKTEMSTTNGRVPTEQVEGTVEATNAKGLKIGGAWVNVSQFHPVELPEVGTHVRLEVDSRGYIKALEVLHAGNARALPGFAGQNDHDLRLAVLNAAANFVGLMGQSREDVRSDHVLPLADKWLAWVNA